MPTGTQGTQAWDRYAFVNNNPVRYNDPTGHGVDCGIGEGCMGNQANPNDLPTSGKGESGTTSEDENKCTGSGLIDQYCVELTPEDAQDLEDLLDNPGDFGTAIGIVGGFSNLVGIIAWENLSELQKAVITALIGMTGLPLSIVVGIISLSLVIVGWETNTLSENLSDSNITQTGGTLTVSTNLLYDVYELQTPSGEIYTSYGAWQAPIDNKVTSNIIYGWMSFRNGSPFSWDW